MILEFLNYRKEINSIDESTEVDEEIAIFSFVSKNDRVIDNFEILYKVSIEETYSAECKIDLTIKPCYKSCKFCSSYVNSSNDENHKCTECKEDEGYYRFPSDPDYNCYSLEEISSKYPGWFLDEGKREFTPCNSTCKTSNGSTDENCLTCGDNKYLYNGKCILYYQYS